MPANGNQAFRSATTEASVRGTEIVVVPRGTFYASRLEVGTKTGDRARVEVDGGELILRQDSLIAGEHTGGEGTLVLKGGAIYSMMDIFVGGATGSTGRMNRWRLVVQGGTMEGLTLTVGEAGVFALLLAA